MDKNPYPFPEDFKHVPVSFFAMTPGAEAVLGGYIIAEWLEKNGKKYQVWKKMTGIIGVVVAWLFYRKCPKAEYREYLRREWRCEC